jgi:hypothetical protein
VKPTEAKAHSVHASLQAMHQAGAGVQEWWSDGVMEYWSDGVLE